MAVPGLDVRLLGPLEVERDHRDLDLGSPKQRAVLAVLALHAGQVVSRARLIGAVWGPDAPAGAAHALQTYVSGLRSVLGAERIERHPGGYLLRLEPGELDLDRLRSAVERASQDPDATADAVAAALALVRGEPLADVADRLQEPNLVDDLDEQVAAAREALARSCLRDGHTTEAADLVAPVLSSHPLRETAVAVRLRALATMGRSAEGLGVYETFRRRLRDELGVDPGPELQEVHRALLATSDAPGDARNPFKGLRAFDEDDAADFFGRDALIREALEVLDRHGLVALVGPSGIGKSSLLRAGIVPALRSGTLTGSDTWEVTILGSGSDLLGHVAPTGHDELVVIDHLEELFTQGGPETDVRRGVRTLVELAEAPRCRVVLALRADRYHEPIRRPELAEIFLAGLVNVLPLRPEELEAAVTGPCTNVGVAVEPALLAELAADLAQHPDALPHLQHTLTELFDARDGRLLRLRDYLGLGGLRGTLERRIESVHGRLDEGRRRTLQRLMLALVVVTDHGVERRTVAIDDLDAADDRDDVALVIERLARWRLVVRDRHPATDEPTLALTHDALLRSWPRLTGWIEAARPDLRRRGVIEGAATAWDDAGRPDELLIGPGALSAHETWATSADVGLGRREQALLEASRARADQLATQAARTRRRDRRRRTLQGVAVAATALLVAWLLVPSAPPRVVVVLETEADPGNRYALAMEEGADEAERQGGVEVDKLVPGSVGGLRQAIQQLEGLCTSPPDGVAIGGMILLPGVKLLQECEDGPPVVVVDGDRAALSSLAWTNHVGMVTYSVEEAAYLAGVAAAVQTETGVVAAVGGMPILPVDRFIAGFAAGAHHADPDVTVLAVYITESEDGGTAFANEEGGRRAADLLLDRDADVILAAAGASSAGVLDAVARRASADEPRWFIGPDENWQGIAPPDRSLVLGSVVKELGDGMEAAVTYLAEGNGEPLDLWLGLEDSGVAFVDDRGHADASRRERDLAAGSILDGTIDPPFDDFGEAVWLPPLEP